jgi:cytochrome d ubiquinol oxidase subunit II
MNGGLLADAVAGVLFGGVILYATFGGADFGAGFWDLTAGGTDAGRRPRALIDLAIGPVWEANHVWLIFCLVVMWTAFPGAFAAIMTTLYLPLGLAALGIVLRGSGFAFRKVSAGTPEQRAHGATFAASSVITPFFFGTVAGGIASGRVPTAGNGDPLGSWINPTSILGGGLAVLVCAYLAAVFLIAEARARRADDLERWFRRRARLAGAVTGVAALGGVAILRADAHRLFERLLVPGLPFVLASAVAGLAALVLVGSGSPMILRGLAAVAAVSVVAGWGVAQYPYLLGTHLSIAVGAAPRATLISVLVVTGIAAVLVLPSLGALYVLQQRGALENG